MTDSAASRSPASAERPAGGHSTCVRCSATGLFEPCCSSHDALMCHLCYRLTHFVEVCGCPTCLADGLPRILGVGKPMTDSAARTLIRDLAALTRAIPDMLADRMDEWVMSVHRPNERTRRPPLAGPNCWACSKPWPCKHHIDAADRHGARANRRAGR